MLKNLLFRGRRIEYEIRGEGLPVMMVHGFPADRRVWDPLLTGLENKYRWILPDLPGSGQSDFNGSLTTLVDFAEALLAIAEQENIREMVLIGHSMGGYISLAFAEKYPERLLSLGLFHSSSYARFHRKKRSPGIKTSVLFKKTGPNRLLCNPFPAYIPRDLPLEIHRKFKNRFSVTPTLRRNLSYCT